jgi:adenylate cyclase
MKKHLLRIIVGLCIVAAFFFHERADYELPFVRKLENQVSDARLRVTMPGGVDPKVVILDIDEKSLKEREQGGEGRWPWPRDRLALLVDKLFDKYQIEVLGFDIVFAERDETSGARVLERLAGKELRGVPQFQNAFTRLRPQLDYDAIFASKLRDRKIVLGYTFNTEPEKKGLLPAPVFTEADLSGHKISAEESRAGYAGNIEILQKNAASAGHFNPANDVDGVLRKVPLVIPHAGKYYEALSLAVVRSYLGMPPVKVVFADYAGGDAALEEISVGGLKIPVDNRARALIPYRGGRNSFKYVSAADVINDRVPVAELRGKLVLMGTSAPALLDLRVTPVEAVYPGVEAHANLVAGMLDEKLKREPAYAEGAQLMVVVLLGLVLAVLLPFLSVVKATLLTGLILAAVVGANFALYQYGNFVLPVAVNVLLVLLLFGLNTIWGYFTETRSKKLITGLFGQYVPPEIVEHMAQDPTSVSFDPDSRDCTVLFTDVRGFTTIAEGLDPKALSELMNEFLTPLTEVIFKHRGTIDKYMGDCIMAFWGAPLPHEAHAQAGVIAGLEMQRVLNELQPKFKAKNWPEIKIGVGLNTGRVSVGNMGSKIRRAYTVMGDAVNLASRLEGITKEYGADIIVGEETMKGSPDLVFRELDKVRVKGKEQAVTIYQPIGLRSDVSDETKKRLDIFHDALTSYRKQAWDTAETQFQHLQDASPDNKLYDLFLKRIPVLRQQNLGPDWDGAVTFETK